MNEQTPERVSTGLYHLDGLLGGGLPTQSLVVLAGVPGAGKSVLAFHMLAEAVAQGQNAMLVTTTHQPVSKLRSQYSSLNFLSRNDVMDRLEVLELQAGVQDATMVTLLNTIVGRLQEGEVGVAAIDSFRAISDLAPNRSQIWRFLGALSAQLVGHGCTCLLLGEYQLPTDLNLPEMAVADVIIYLEVERLTASDLRTLRIYKMRGGKYTPGRQAFDIDDEGIHFLGDSVEEVLSRDSATEGLYGIVPDLP